MKNDNPTSLRAKRGNLIERGIASVFARLRNDGKVLLILLILSVPLTLQTFQPGFFVGDDGEWMIIRSSAFHETLRDGQFPVRYLGRLNHEFGYPVATFLYPGYLYLTEPFVILGFGFIDSIKIMFALTMVLSGIFAYLWLSKLFGKWSTLIGALVYLYTPYHLVDMYNRGSLGELLALAVVPFIFWQIERKSLFFSAVGIAGLILSHNILAAVFLPVIFLYALLSFRAKRSEVEESSQHSLVKRSLHSAIASVGMTSRKAFKSTILILLFGLGLAAFFWIPALFELQYTVFNQTIISEWQHYFAPYSRIGGLPAALIFTSIVVLLFQKQFKDAKSFLTIKENKVLFIFFTIIGLVSIFFSSSFSTQLWHILPVTFIQFPFRFLSLEIVACAFLAAYLMSALRLSATKIVFGAVVACSLCINALPYLTHIAYFDKGEGFYTTNQSTTNTRDEYMPLWVKQKPLQRVEEKVVITKGEGNVSAISLDNKTIAFTVNAKKENLVQINKIYWPGWTAIVDGKQATIDYKNPKGVMTIKIPEGNHTVVFSFQETPLRLFADVLTCLSFIALVGFLLITHLSFPRRRDSR